MSEYRLYFLDQNHRINKADDLLCSDDVSAIQEATLKADGQPVELWQGARMVASTLLKPGTQTALYLHAF